MITKWHSKQSPYTRADLDWTNKNSRSSIEMNDKSFRPQIAQLPNSLADADYDTIFLGFPIWWYVAPTIINTFHKIMIDKSKSKRKF